MEDILIILLLQFIGALLAYGLGSVQFKWLINPGMFAACFIEPPQESIGQGIIVIFGYIVRFCPRANHLPGLLFVKRGTFLAGTFGRFALVQGPVEDKIIRCSD